MFESDVGLSVSLTRQCCGIGSGAGAGPPALAPLPRPPAVAAGTVPAGAGGGAGCGGGVNTPAGTTSADITVVWGVESDFRLSQFAGDDAASNRANASISASSRRAFEVRRPATL